MTRGEEHFAFHEAYALAVTQWATVERALLEVLAGCVRAEDFNMVGHGFFSIENFRSKLSFADAMLRQKVTSKSDLEHWELLCNRLRSASSFRNRLVHERVVMYPMQSAGRRYAIQPWIDKGKGRKPSSAKPPPGALCVRDLVGIRFNFFALHCSLKNFSSRLRGQKAQFPESSEQPMSPPTLASLRRQIHEVLGARPSPLRR